MHLANQLIDIKPLLELRSISSYTRLTSSVAIMETTKLSSKGQVVIPSSLRNSNHWKAGQEFNVTDTGNGVLLTPRAPFSATVLSEVASMLSDKLKPRSDDEIKAALQADMRRKWRGRD